MRLDGKVYGWEHITVALLNGPYWAESGSKWQQQCKMAGGIPHSLASLLYNGRLKHKSGWYKKKQTLQHIVLHYFILQFEFIVTYVKEYIFFINFCAIFFKRPYITDWTCFAHVQDTVRQLGLIRYWQEELETHLPSFLYSIWLRPTNSLFPKKQRQTKAWQRSAEWQGGQIQGGFLGRLSS